MLHQICRSFPHGRSLHSRTGVCVLLSCLRSRVWLLRRRARMQGPERRSHQKVDDGTRLKECIRHILVACFSIDSLPNRCLSESTKFCKPYIHPSIHTSNRWTPRTLPTIQIQLSNLLSQPCSSYSLPGLSSINFQSMYKQFDVAFDKVSRIDILPFVIANGHAEWNVVVGIYF